MMRMSLLHALTVALTVLLFVVRHHQALAGLFSGKRSSIGEPDCQHGSCDKLAARAGSAMLAPVELQLFISNPKYKRDPEINVDSEEIGYEPLL